MNYCKKGNSTAKFFSTVKFFFGVEQDNLISVNRKEMQIDRKT